MYIIIIHGFKFQYLLKYMLKINQYIFNNSKYLLPYLRVNNMYILSKELQ